MVMQEVLPQVEEVRTASVLETERKQQAALKIVQHMSRAAGRELPIVTAEDGNFPDEPGLYLIGQGLPAAAQIRDANFNLTHRQISGMADSAHAVLAGTLSVELAGTSNTQLDLQVAAKCYEKRTPQERLMRAHREVYYMQWMASQNKPTMMPVAVAVGTPESGSHVVLFTGLQEDLLTFDNTPWGRGATSGNVSDALLCSKALGVFNAEGNEHGDAKPKNFASLNTAAASPLSRANLIDFETTHAVDPEDAIAMASATYKDLGLLMMDLGKRGFFTPKKIGFGNTADNVVSAVQTIVEDGYLPAFSNASEHVQSAVYNAAVEIADQTIGSHLHGYPHRSL